jgi:hypothetical protein
MFDFRTNTDVLNEGIFLEIQVSENSSAWRGKGLFKVHEELLQIIIKHYYL